MRRHAWQLLCVVVLGAGAMTSRAEMLYQPIFDGTTITLTHSGTYNDSHGNSGQFGPLVQTIGFNAVNLQIIDHQADFSESEGVATEVGFLLEDSNGLFRIADGDPRDNEWYEYYENPRPFLANDDLATGESAAYDGLWRGQWENGQGGYDTWSGTWAVTITNMGPESVTTPLGTFNAYRFREVETNTKSTGPNHLNTETSTEDLWTVPGYGLVRVKGAGRWESDYDGDGNIDVWEEETWIDDVVAYNGGALPPLGTDAAKPNYASNGTATQQVNDALDAVEASMASYPLGEDPPQGGVGFLSGLVTLDEQSVDNLIDALEADGAQAEERFVHLVLSYDDAALASLGIAEPDLAPYWWDEDSDRWVFVGTTTSGTRGAGKKATLAAHMNMVGYYGLDTINNEVWLNVNHASTYGIGTSLPEPSALLMLLAGSALMIRRNTRTRGGNGRVRD